MPLDILIFILQMLYMVKSMITPASSCVLQTSLPAMLQCISQMQQTSTGGGNRTSQCHYISLCPSSSSSTCVMPKSSLTSILLVSGGGQLGMPLIEHCVTQEYIQAALGLFKISQVTRITYMTFNLFGQNSFEIQITCG